MDVRKVKGNSKELQVRDEMAKKQSGAHDAALNLGVLDEIFLHHENMGYKKRGYRLINFDFCALIVLDCVTRSEFKEKDPAAYNRARKQGWLDEIFKNHRFCGYASEAMMKRHINASERKT